MCACKSFLHAGSNGVEKHQPHTITTSFINTHQSARSTEEGVTTKTKQQLRYVDSEASMDDLIETDNSPIHRAEIHAPKLKDRDLPVSYSQLSLISNQNQAANLTN